MALNPRNKSGASSADIEKLANKLADKPYEGSPANPEPARKDNVIRSISMPRELDDKLNRLAAKNALDGTGPKNVSSLLRHIITEYVEKNPMD